MKWVAIPGIVSHLHPSPVNPTGRWCQESITNIKKEKEPVGKPTGLVTEQESSPVAETSTRLLCEQENTSVVLNQVVYTGAKDVIKN